ncbi:TRAP transporter large permease protein OS=Castellaniella defragrans OX=75697 GN=HNR28_002222 PE=3 SV=1 [Castellaniella defragrans]
MSSYILFGLFIFLFLFRIPIAFSLGVSSVVAFLYEGFNLVGIPERMFSALTLIPLIAIPGFVFAGVVMARGGISKYLMEGLNAWIGHISGGMGIVTIMACAIFAAVSGSSPATAAAIGSVAIPGLVESGYSKRYAMGLVAAGGTLGILIPPSISLILYGVETQTSISKLFVAGVLPGIFLAGVLMVVAIYYARKNGFGQAKDGHRHSWAERWQASRRALWGTLLPILIIFCIYDGVATPTETSVIGGFYAVLVAAFIHKELKWKDIRPILTETVQITSMIYMIIASAVIFGTFLSFNQIPQGIAGWVISSHLDKTGFFIVTGVMFFILGTFLDAASIVIITIPIFLPTLNALQINLYHFAIFVVVSLELGMITPPVGLNLFVVSGICNEPLEEVVRAVIPFIVVMLAVLVIIAVWPGLSLFLLHYM